MAASSRRLKLVGCVSNYGENEFQESCLDNVQQGAKLKKYKTD
jgi:hypothetical protein